MLPFVMRSVHSYINKLQAEHSQWIEFHAGGMLLEPSVCVFCVSKG